MAGILRFPSWIFVALTALFSVKIFDLTLKNAGDMSPQATKAELLIRRFLLICLFVAFYPVIKAYTQGQIQSWINSLFCISFWRWITGRKRVSGVFAGFICLIKPQFSTVFLWGVLRKQWGFISAFAITSATIFLVSISIFGLANHIDYLKVLSFISRHGESYYPNQSINSLLNRLLSNGNNLSFDPKSFPPFNPWVYAGTTISSVILIAVALFWPVNTRQKVDVGAGVEGVLVSPELGGWGTKNVVQIKTTATTHMSPSKK